MREITYLNLYIDIDKCYIIHCTYLCNNPNRYDEDDLYTILQTGGKF